MRLFRAIRAAITAFNHSLFEPQCSNATDSEVHLTADSRQCMEELEHAASDYSTDCNNAHAMTSEQPLSDESKQWIAKDTCSGRDSADTCYMHKFANALHKSADDRQMHNEQLCNRLRQFTMDEWTEKSDALTNHTERYSMQSISNALISNYLPCSSAHTPTAEPQAQLTPTDTPTVKREYV